jgi:predicted DNA-binding antitoxin AbrB/MazE fold protein
MSHQIDAIFDNGVLRPLVPLALPDKTRVKVTVESQLAETTSLEPHDDWERRLLAVAKDCGVSLSDSAVGSEGLYD